MLFPQISLNLIYHKNKVGVEEIYETISVLYVGKGNRFSEKHIQIEVKNITQLKSVIPTNISGIFGGGNITAGGSILNYSTITDNVNEELKLKLGELKEAIESKDKFKISTVFSSILDKSADLGVAILTEGLFK